MFINWLLTVFPVEMTSGWRLVSRDLVLWLFIATISALLAALAASTHGHAPPALTIIQGLAPLLVTFLAAAKFDAAARESAVNWGDLGKLLISRGLPLFWYAAVAGLVAHFPARLVAIVTGELLRDTPMGQVIPTAFSAVILISLLARFSFVPFMAVLLEGEEVQSKLPATRLGFLRAILWPLFASDHLSDGYRWRIAPYVALPYLIDIAVNLTPGVAQILALTVGQLIKMMALAVVYRYYAARWKAVSQSETAGAPT
jgi:hypothetical protein